MYADIDRFMLLSYEYYMCVDIYRNIDKIFTHLVNSVNWSRILTTTNKQPPLVPKYNYEATKSELWCLNLLWTITDVEVEKI